jgi:hypothetical protein
MNRTLATALVLVFVTGCAPTTWRYQFDQPDKTPNLRQLDQLQCQNQLKEEDKLQFWWEIDEHIWGCTREKGYRYVQAEAIRP